jgi:putative ABC transport system permease protein
MWRNYVTVGVRALMKNRTYAFINIVGLAIGLAACLLLLLYVRYERSYDEWLPNHENIYQVQSRWENPETGEVSENQTSAYVVGTTLEKDFPQIEGRAYGLFASPVVMRDGEALPTENVFYVDGPFFDVLPLPLLSSDPATAARSERVMGSFYPDEILRAWGSVTPCPRRRGRSARTAVSGSMQS